MTSIPDPTRIGRLVEVHEASMIALLDTQGDFPLVRLEKDTVRVGQVGSYVLIRQLDTVLMAMIVHGKIERDGTGVLTLIPLGEIVDDSRFRRGVVNFPTPGAAVHYIEDRYLDIVFNRYADKGYDIGTVPFLPSKGVCLDPTTLFGRHVAILGQSGSGKSWGVTTLLQRAIHTMPNAHIIIMDLHGEYVWYDDDGNLCSAFPKDSLAYFDARDLEIPYWLLTYSELIDLLIDPEDEKAPTQKAFLREVVLALRRKANKELDTEVQISIDTPVYFSMVELYSQFKKANEQTYDFGKSKGPLFGQFDEFLIKLQSRFNDVRYDFLFKPKKRKSSESLAGLLADFVGLGEKKAQVTVIDFSGVPFDVRPMVSAQVGRLAFEFNYWNPRSDEFPILLVCEEAHNYIPREKGTQYDGARRSMERIAKEGRKYGVALAVVSQRPHELSETVLAQCGNYICFRVTNPEDQEYIRALVPDAEGDLVNTLAALGRGEVLALGEAIPIPTRIKLYRPDPEPNSSSVDYHLHWKEGVKDLDVEAVVRRWRRQGR